MSKLNVRIENVSTRSLNNKSADIFLCQLVTLFADQKGNFHCRIWKFF